MTTRTHDRIAAFCHKPRKMEEILEHVGCNKTMVYLLRQRGMLRNIGNKRGGLFQTVEGVSVEPERTFDLPNHIVQASSVWHYACRCAMEARA